jgi:hypothetical protein
MTLSKENGTQKNDIKTRKKNDAHKLTDHNKDLRNHRSLIRESKAFTQQDDHYWR